MNARKRMWMWRANSPYNTLFNLADKQCVLCRGTGVMYIGSHPMKRAWQECDCLCEDKVIAMCKSISKAMHEHNKQDYERRLIARRYMAMK